VNDVIEATGHELWLPIPLDRETDGMYDELLQRFGHRDQAPDSAALVVGVARRLADANADVERTGMQNLAAWALLERPDVLTVRALATLRVALLEPDLSADEVVRGLSDGESLFEAPVLQPMDTRSGEALSVRLRPMVEEAGASRVHEVAAVLWQRSAQQAWYILSTYVTDLVEAAEIAGFLEELGAGIEGL
jgi:hypothetical protein